MNIVYLASAKFIKVRLTKGAAFVFIFFLTKNVFALSWTPDELVTILENISNNPDSPPSTYVLPAILNTIQHSNLSLVDSNFLWNQPFPNVEYSGNSSNTPPLVELAPLSGFDVRKYGVENFSSDANISTSNNQLTQIDGNGIALFESLTGPLFGQSSLYINWKTKLGIYYPPIPPICEPPDPLKPTKIKCHGGSDEHTDWSYTDPSWKDTLKVDIDGRVNANIQTKLNYYFDVAGKQIVVKNAGMSGDISLSNNPSPSFNINKYPILGDTLSAGHFLSVINGLFDHTAQDMLLPPITDAFNQNATANFNDWVSMQNNMFENRLASLGGNSLPTGAFGIALPEPDEKLVPIIANIFENRGVHPLAIVKVMQDNWDHLLVDLLSIGIESTLAELFTWPTVCAATAQFRIDLTSSPIYTNQNGACSVADTTISPASIMYSDSQCLNPITFQNDNQLAMCKEYFFGEPNPYVGNPKKWTELGYALDNLDPNESTAWTISGASKYQLGPEPIGQKNAPYMKRVNFKEINGCELEMRIFKKNIGATNLKPLLLIHGGSWYRRALGAFATETTIANYTQDDFIVFFPFYRLSGGTDDPVDGPEECRDASWDEILSDADDALTWVYQHGEAYGANTNHNVDVGGMSAGAFLASWLVTHRSAEIDRGLLLYPPTDTYDFISRLRINNPDGSTTGFTDIPYPDGAHYNPTPYQKKQGVAPIYALLDPLPIDVSGKISKEESLIGLINYAPLPDKILETSFARIVASAPDVYPPVFILHGVSDQTVPVSQAKTLCNAYGGNVTDDDGFTDVRSEFDCGKSKLHLFLKADHALDYCPPQVFYFFGKKLCPSGDLDSTYRIVESLVEARTWLKGASQINPNGLNNGLINHAPPAAWQGISNNLDVRQDTYNASPNRLSNNGNN